MAFPQGWGEGVGDGNVGGGGWEREQRTRIWPEWDFVSIFIVFHTYRNKQNDGWFHPLLDCFIFAPLGELN